MIRRVPGDPRSTSVIPYLGVVAVGAALVGLYYVLGALEIGNIGAPSDIGGGLIPLTGYILILVGSLKTVAVLLRRR